MLLFFLACAEKPSPNPIITPVEEPTNEPTSEPENTPTSEPAEEAASEPTSEPTNEPTNEPAEEPASEPTNEPEALILEEGNWAIGTTTVISDVCDINNYNDVTNFTAAEIGIAQSTENDFLMTPDNLLCTRNDLEFTCEALSLEQEAIVGATLIISNTIRGTIIDDKNMDLYFDVNIETCEGWMCWSLELALTWPCLIELEAPAYN